MAGFARHALGRGFQNGEAVDIREHKVSQRFVQRATETDSQCEGTADFADFKQIKGVLAHAGLPVWV